ncbi:MAG: hypothetical protein ACRCU5_15620 [Rhizobiaceae bacterium]
MMQQAGLPTMSSVINALRGAFMPTDKSASEACLSKAHRVGPQRVILTLALGSKFENFNVDLVALSEQSLQFGVVTLDSESVEVVLTAGNTLEARSRQSKPEHKVTLKVRPETTRLTIKLKDAKGAIFKTEQIEIK